MPEYRVESGLLPPNDSPADLVWKRPSDADVARLRTEISVNRAEGAGILVSNPLKEPHEREHRLKAVIDKSGVHRLVDLGSSYSIEQGVQGDSTKLRLEYMGIHEYIGIDLGFESDAEWDWKPSPELLDLHRPLFYPDYQERDESFHIKLKRQEILTALHELPDNFSHISMTGIEKYNIIKNYGNWGIAVLSEAKRVVPENGIFYTDNGFMDDIIRECIPAFSDLYNPLMRIDNLDPHGSYSTGNKRNPKKEIEELQQKVGKFICPEDDPFRLGRYVLDAPEIGFRIYLNGGRRNYEPIILVNTNKTRKRE